MFEEVAYGLENFGIPVEEIERRVVEVMKLTDIEALAMKSPFDLSGGQITAKCFGIGHRTGAGYSYHRRAYKPVGS